MPVVVEPEAPGEERGALPAYLEAQRGGVRRALHGLTEEQARSTPSAGALSLSGVVLKHVTSGERGWLSRLRDDPADFDHATSQREWEDSFGPHTDETVPVLLDRYAVAARETDAAVRAVDSPDRTFLAPQVPWDGGGARSWRWAPPHLIEETARHAGHADVIRESPDGKGAFELVFATGAMPEPDRAASDAAAGAPAGGADPPRAGGAL